MQNSLFCMVESFWVPKVLRIKLCFIGDLILSSQERPSPSTLYIKTDAWSSQDTSHLRGPHIALLGVLWFDRKTSSPWHQVYVQMRSVSIKKVTFFNLSLTRLGRGARIPPAVESGCAGDRSLQYLKKDCFASPHTGCALASPADLRACRGSSQ